MMCCLVSPSGAGLRYCAVAMHSLTTTNIPVLSSHTFTSPRSMCDRDKTILVGNIHSCVTEEVLFELFLQVSARHHHHHHRHLHLHHHHLPSVWLLICMDNNSLDEPVFAARVSLSRLLAFRELTHTKN